MEIYYSSFYDHVTHTNVMLILQYIDCFFFAGVEREVLRVVATYYIMHSVFLTVLSAGEGKRIS